MTPAIRVFVALRCTANRQDTAWRSQKRISAVPFHVLFGELRLTWQPNLVPRSHSVTGNVRSGKVRFRACSVPARPDIRAFLSLRMFVLSVVILGDLGE